MSVSSRLCVRLFAFQPETDAEAAFTERLCVGPLLRLPRSSERRVSSPLRRSWTEPTASTMAAYATPRLCI